jgi:hypothetical protein
MKFNACISAILLLSLILYYRGHRSVAAPVPPQAPVSKAASKVERFTAAAPVAVSSPAPSAKVDPPSPRDTLVALLGKPGIEKEMSAEEMKLLVDAATVLAKTDETFFNNTFADLLAAGRECGMPAGKLLDRGIQNLADPVPFSESILNVQLSDQKKHERSPSISVDEGTCLSLTQFQLLNQILALSLEDYHARFDDSRWQASLIRYAESPTTRNVSAVILALKIFGKFDGDDKSIIQEIVRARPDGEWRVYSGYR